MERNERVASNSDARQEGAKQRICNVRKSLARRCKSRMGICQDELSKVLRDNEVQVKGGTMQEVAKQGGTRPKVQDKQVQDNEVI